MPETVLTSLEAAIAAPRDISIFLLSISAYLDSLQRTDRARRECTERAASTRCATAESAPLVLGYGLVQRAALVQHVADDTGGRLRLDRTEVVDEAANPQRQPLHLLLDTSHVFFDRLRRRVRANQRCAASDDVERCAHE